MTNDTRYRHLLNLNVICEGHFSDSNDFCTSHRLDLTRLYQTPSSACDIFSALAHICTPQIADYVVGVGEQSTLLAFELARLLSASCLFTTRQSGVMTLSRTSSIPKGARVLIVKDIVHTGSSIRETIELLRAFRVQIIGIASLFDLSQGKAVFRFPFYSYLSIPLTIRPRCICPLCQRSIPFTVL